MKHKNGWQQKLRHGSLSLGLTAAVVVAVLVLNIVFTALFAGNLWYIDLTPKMNYFRYGMQSEQKQNSLYTLMDETVEYLGQIISGANQKREENDPVKVDIIFCADPDILKANASMRYVYYTALDLQKHFPDTIRVSYRDVWKNPSSVDMFRTTTYSEIYQTNVIVSSGSEFRVNSLRSFFTFDSDAEVDTVIGYNGQKQFVKQILDVTGAQAPICCLTVNHGEPFKELMDIDRSKWPEYKSFLNLIEAAGYEVQFLDLNTQEIPEDCRLIITYDPQTDFVPSGKDTEAETVKLSNFLDKSYSFMVFLDADSPELPNLKEYLEFWGIDYMRHDGVTESGESVTGNYLIRDPVNGLNYTGDRFAAQYPEGQGLGKAVLDDLVSSNVFPKIIFENATAISFSDYYQTLYMMADEKEGTAAYSYGYYFEDGVERTVYHMFQAGSKTSPAQYSVVSDGKALSGADGTPLGGSAVFDLMTIAREKRVVAEGSGYTQVLQDSYVCAVGSTAFATEEFLQTTACGNADALLATLRYIGKDVNPVGLNFVELHSTEITESLYQTTDPTTGITRTLPAINVTTAVFAILPGVVVSVIGAVVLIKRKLRHG